MDDITWQWYHTLIETLGLDRNRFQLYQGSLSLGNDSEWLWNILDTIPPKSINHYYDPSQRNFFSQNYGAILNQLKPIKTNAFQICMGDYYMLWNNYLKNAKIPTDFFTNPATTKTFFKNWTLASAPSKICCEATYLASIYGDFISKAIISYNNANTLDTNLAYNIEMQSVRTNLALSKSVQFDTKNISKRKRSDELIDPVNLLNVFSENAKRKLPQLHSIHQKINNSTITITGTFKHTLVVEGHPLQQKNTSPTLGKQLPWFIPLAFRRAYNTKNNTVWKNGTPNWESVFGESGSLQRDTNGLILVDGIDITINSTESFTEVERRLIHTNKAKGVWPFYGDESSSRIKNKVVFKGKTGGTQIHTSSEAGNPIVIGVYVDDLDSSMKSKKFII